MEDMNDQGFNQEMEDLVTKFAGGPQAQKYFTGIEEGKQPKKKTETTRRQRSNSKDRKLKDIDKISLEVERQLKQQRKKEKENIKQGKMEVSLKNLAPMPRPKSNTKVNIVKARKPSRAELIDEKSMGNSESINILMSANMDEQEKYTLPEDDNSNVIDATARPKASPFEEEEDISKRFDATGGTSGIDIEGMMNEVKNENEKFDEPGYGEENDENDENDDIDNEIEDNYLDEFEQYRQDQTQDQVQDASPEKQPAYDKANLNTGERKRVEEIEAEIKTM